MAWEWATSLYYNATRSQEFTFDHNKYRYRVRKLLESPYEYVVYSCNGPTGQTCSSLVRIPSTENTKDVLPYIDMVSTLYIRLAGPNGGEAVLERELKNTAPNWGAIPTQSVRKNSAVSVYLPNYAHDADGNALSFSVTSSNPGIASVSVSGGNLTITGVAKGTATITVHANDGTVSVPTTFTVSVVNTGPTGITIPSQSTKKDAVITLNLANYFSDVDLDALSYAVSSSNPSVAIASVAGNILTLTGKKIGSAWVSVDASDGQYTATQGFTLTVTNTAPTVSVSSPSANMTLYENDTFNVAGSASDVNVNQSVTIYAQINLEQRIVLGVGLSNAAIPFNKQLKFVGGKLYDGDTVITGNLTDGVPHTLKIWAQDGDGAQSAITERTFYVVPNRPPVLTVDTVQPGGIINTDKFTISGGAGDPDGNTVTAAYRINGGNSIALEIIDGKWAFDIALAQLVVGQNTIIVELMDSYNFKVSKTIKLNKSEVKTPILQSIARYRIEPPKGSAKGVLLFLERDVDLDLIVELSMTLVGEQENYVTLTQENTAPMPNQTGVVEDTYYHEANEQKNNIILKLSTSRPDVNINHKIHLISGVVD
ncbi:MAG: Ig-like domain-containing protein [Solibacillus sp.]